MGIGFLVWKQERRIKPAAAQLPEAKVLPALGNGAFLKPRATGEKQGYGTLSLSSPRL